MDKIPNRQPRAAKLATGAREPVSLKTFDECINTIERALEAFEDGRQTRVNAAFITTCAKDAAKIISMKSESKDRANIGGLLAALSGDPNEETEESLDRKFEEEVREFSLLAKGPPA